MLEDWAGIWGKDHGADFLSASSETSSTLFINFWNAARPLQLPLSRIWASLSTCSPAVFRLLKGHLSLKAGQFPVMSLSLSVRPPYAQTPLPNTGHFSAISSSFKKCGYCRIKRSYGHKFIGHALIDSQLQHRQPKLQL